MKGLTASWTGKWMPAVKNPLSNLETWRKEFAGLQVTVKKATDDLSNWLQCYLAQGMANDVELQWFDDCNYTHSHWYLFVSRMVMPKGPTGAWNKVVLGAARAIKSVAIW